MTDEEIRKRFHELSNILQRHELKIYGLEKDVEVMRIETARVAKASEATQQSCADLKTTMGDWTSEQKGIKREQEEHEKRRNRVMTAIVIFAPIGGMIAWETFKHVLGWK